jgi:hypothetical protein
MNSKKWVFLLFLLILLFGSIVSSSLSHSNKDSFTNKRNVDIPLTTWRECTNKCGPSGVCSISGEDCSSDKDCYGCKPTKNNTGYTKPIPIPEEDSGKLLSIKPYSVLTHDMASDASLLSEQDKYTNPPHYNQGVNQWRHAYNVATDLYNKRYNSVKYTGGPKYPERRSLTDEFPDTNPTPANAYMLHELGYNY